MSENTQDKEFKAFGFISSNLRSGFLIGIVILLTSAVVVQFKIILDIQEEKQRMQADLYKQIIDRVDQKVNEKLDQPVRQINQGLKNIDKSLSNVDTATKRANQITNQLRKKYKEN